MNRLQCKSCGTRGVIGSIVRKVGDAQESISVTMKAEGLGWLVRRLGKVHYIQHEQQRPSKTYPITSSFLTP